MMARKLFAVLFILATSLILLIFFWHQQLYQSYYEYSSKSRAKQHSGKKRKLILSWGHPWNNGNWSYREGQKVGKCKVTYDRSRINDSIAVLFHFTTIGRKDIPWKHYRDPKQVFIWWTGESPASFISHGQNLREFDGGFFNWTMTQRRDADVTKTFAYRADVLRKLKKGRTAVSDLIKRKKKLTIWIVSQCDYTSGAILRMQYVKRLIAAGLPVSLYGSCFKNSKSLPKSNKTLLYETIREHKFYLAFENALHCTDYITEKFWANSLMSDAVPVVWGPKKEDVLSVAPLDSFVYAEDFENPAKLAEYLLHLNANEQEYRKYFRWREKKTMTEGKMKKLLRYHHPDNKVFAKPKHLCDKLLERKEDKIIDSLTSEFMNKNPPECLAEPKSKL